MRKKHGAWLAVLAISLLAVSGFVSSSGAATAGPAVRLAPQVRETPGGTGPVFLTTSLTIYYTGGTVRLASHGNGGKIVTDDLASLTVTHEDGSTSTWSHDFSNSCSGQDTPIPQVDISALLEAGRNTLSFQESDVCGGSFGGSPYWVRLP
jgi:hypothetical protein